MLYSDFSGGQLEKWLYPNDNLPDAYDAADLAKEKGINNLQVYLDCGGANDPFSDGVQSLNTALQKRGINAEFEMHGGGHSLQLDKTGDYLLFYNGE
jgi:predicted esterase